SSCTQPKGASLVLGSDAVNFAVFGHIGTAFGMSSIACTWTSITGGGVVVVFCARDTPVTVRHKAMQLRDVVARRAESVTGSPLRVRTMIRAQQPVVKLRRCTEGAAECSRSFITGC